MDALAADDGTLSGVLAWLSTTTSPTKSCHRADGASQGAADGVPVLLTFQAGDGPKHFTHQWGTDVDIKGWLSVQRTISCVGGKSSEPFLHD